MSISSSWSCRLLSAKIAHFLNPRPSSLTKNLISSIPITPSNLSFFKPISIQRMPTKSPPPPSSSSSPPTSMSLQPIEELPPKLQEIIKLFQTVNDSKSKYEQLMFYGKNLTPLEPQFKNNANKVQGCVSQVWVRAYLDSDRNVVYEADSDSILTKGLAALLVLGLSGRPVDEILRVSPDFVTLLGLQQSLTPSRNNGFLNMLKLMQKKALQVYIEAEKGAELAVAESSNDGAKPIESSNSGLKVNGSGEHLNLGVSSEVDVKEDELTESETGGIKSNSGVLGSRGERIRERLERELSSIELDIEDVSYQHAGHAGVKGSDGETHFNVKVVSKDFEGKSMIKRHRLIYNLLQDELQSGLHALSIVAKTPSEIDR